MSFSNKVKEELTGLCDNRRHCRIAETAAIIGMCGNVSISEFDRYSVSIISENIFVAKKIYLLLRRTYNVVPDIAVRGNAKKENRKKYAVVVKKHEDSINILKSIGLLNKSNEIKEELSDEKNPIFMKNCCKRAFLRGGFLSSGYIGDPSKAYHLEIVCNSHKKSEYLVKILQTFEIEAKIVARKGYFVVYIKEGQGIVNTLNVIGAHVSLMELENIRIIREMRNELNRRVNCETANMYKTVSTSVKQCEAIKHIENTIGLSKLPESLREMAYVRLDNPEASLADLGQMLKKPLGKSGVNHRLRRICEISDNIREQSKEVKNDYQEYYD